MQCETVIIPRIPTSEVEAEQVEPHISRSKLERAQTLEALAYRQGLSSILQGQLKRGSMPVPCTAVWLWKTQAAKVKNGTIVAVKPDAEHGGLGCGPAGDDERVILLLAGSGLNENGPLVAPLAWTMTRQSGLRMFILKVRKMSHTSGSETFSAPLQDALAGYAYLVDRLGFLPRNITLLGEGAGASLCVALTLYLSAVSQMEEVEVALGRPGKMLLFSPWCDMTVSADILRQYSHFDVIDLSARLRSRARYISTFQQSVGEDKVDDLLQGLCSRYQVREGIDFALLGSELAETVESLGAVHPLVSPGMPIACNGYTELAMQLLGTQSGPPLGIFICAGSAQAHITEARSLAANLSSIQGVEIDYIEGEDKVTGFPFITASAAKTKVIKLCQAFLSN
jgi:acetyl esterase/lipase